MASLLLLIGFILLIVSCCSSDDVSTRLVACYNKGGPLTASFDSFLSGKPPSLAIHKIWRTNSTKAGHAGTDDLTIVTAATLQRLDALKSQCKSYPGPVSAAVYIPLLVRHNLTAWRITDLSQAHRAVLSSASDLLDEAFQSSEQDSRSCHYHALMLVIEPVSDASIASLLPINALRNIALVAAATPLIAMVDVDLLLSSSLEGTLKQPSDDPLSSDSILKSSQGSNSKRPIAWILPAYETPKLLDLKDGIELVEQAVRGPKAGLGELIASGKIQSFASAFYPKGHACTDFRQWFNSTDPILVNYTVNCEPWFIISRHLCPFYDARFRGYGWNKVQQVAHVNSSGFQFVLHPNAFLIHRPHAKSDAQGIYTSVTSRNASIGSKVSHGKLFHRKVASLRHRALRDMKRGTFEPVLDPGSSSCIDSLPWWTNRSRSRAGND